MHPIEIGLKETGVVLINVRIVVRNAQIKEMYIGSIKDERFLVLERIGWYYVKNVIESMIENTTILIIQNLKRRVKIVVRE